MLISAPCAPTRFTPYSRWPLAALSAAESRLVLAPLSAELAVTLPEDGYIQALPDGPFAAVDGRPADVASGQWQMDAEAFAALKANTPHQQGDLVIDYEHQTLNKDKNGQPAPAAGFFSLGDLDYRPGKGLFIKPRWTEKAQAMLAAGEYRYFSLVFGYNPADGRPIYLHSGALTNRPGVDGMLPLADLSAHLALRLNRFADDHAQELTLSTDQETLAMDLLKQLLAKLGLTLEDDAPTAEQATAALAALDALSAQAADNTEKDSRIAALTADLEQARTTQGVPLNQYVPIATYNALRDELAALSAQQGSASIEQAIRDAREAGKILPAEVDYYTALGQQQGLAALTALLDTRAPIAALTGQQSRTVTPPAKPSETALSAEEQYAAAQLGLSETDYRNAKEAN
ncbi:phage protease [Ferrimonas balearica]|uniref:phage protease n=1 Tax=Ferrimonas balearica TaxID=44012 RepID=UPI001C97C516|nr:phage protease [Ferrimonas balearica]MBY6223565.1 phage protease [Ferrimonas balearica]